MQFFQDVVDLVFLGLFQGVVRVLEIGTGIAQGRIQPLFVELIAQVIMGADFFPLGGFVFGRVEQVVHCFPVQGEPVHLLQEAFQHGEQIPVHFNIPPHIGFAQGHGGGSH